MSTANTAVNHVQAFARSCHPSCVACGDPEHGGLGLRFTTNEDDSVTARFHCDPRYEGYPGQLHGGVIAMLLDAAMMHWLFAHAIVGVTTRITVQYRHPVLVDTQVDVQASLLEESPSYYVLRAQIVQGGMIRAVAEGMFTDTASSSAERGRSR